VPVKIAQEQLGHASISTTLNIYTHVVEASHRKAIEAVERELFPTVPKSPGPLAAAKPVSDAVNGIQEWRRRPSFDRLSALPERARRVEGRI